MHKLVLSRRPFVQGLSGGFLAFQTSLIFLLATETSFIVSAETHETIPDSLRTLFLNRVGVACFSIARMNCGLLSPEAIKPGITPASGDRESPAWNKPLIDLFLFESGAGGERKFLAFCSQVEMLLPALSSSSLWHKTQHVSPLKFINTATILMYIRKCRCLETLKLVRLTVPCGGGSCVSYDLTEQGDRKEKDFSFRYLLRITHQPVPLCTGDLVVMWQPAACGWVPTSSAVCWRGMLNSSCGSRKKHLPSEECTPFPSMQARCCCRVFQSSPSSYFRLLS